MLELWKVDAIDTQIPVAAVDLLHFDPSNPDGYCDCGYDRLHCTRKQCHTTSHQSDDMSE